MVNGRVGSGAVHNSIAMQLEYDPFHTNAARYAAWQKKSLEKQNHIYNKHMSAVSLPQQQKDAAKHADERAKD